MTGPSINTPIDRHSRPKNALTFSVDTLATAQALVHDLEPLGISPDGVLLLDGDDGLAAFNYTAEDEGWFVRLLKSFRPMGRDSDAVIALQDHLKDGHVIALVPVGDADFDSAVEVLRKHRSSNITYFDTGYMETIQAVDHPGSSTR